MMKKSRKALAVKTLSALCIVVMLLSLSGCGGDYKNPENRGETSFVFSKNDVYQNNLEVEGQWGESKYSAGGQYGIGDPFVLRFDGMYYLYPSSPVIDGEQGIKVYSSPDMINWEYKGFAAQGDITAGAYAPEVVYYNGVFYMTESPGGTGHYILKSDSPLGPFTPVTDNFGRNIDGSFYVGDDSSLYFIYPANNVIQIAKIDKDTMLPEIETALPATLNGWTEGPSLFRRGNMLYLTYTGNNVTSDGYRVGYSYQMGTEPKGDYIMPENNIILLRTGPENFRGLGHSSNVVGPNLDSWYTAYHNLISVAGPQRRLMIDRLVTNGGMLLANGPTYTAVSTPARPDFETRGTADLKQADAGKRKVYASKAAAKEIFTAEYSFSNSKSAIELLCGFDDQKNYTSVRVDMEKGEISLISTKNSKESVVKKADIAGLTADNLHTVRIENGAEQTDVSIDGMRKITVKDLKVGAGKIAVFGDADFGYIAYANDAFGTSDFEAVKNLPCTFPAVHYLKEENRGFSIKKAKNVAGGIRQNEPENTLKNEDDGSYSLKLDSKNDWVKYAVNAAEESFYGLSALISPESAGAQLQVIEIGRAHV